MNGAEAEASLLIRKGQVWVHEICALGQRPEIASIVATTSPTAVPPADATSEA